MRDIWSFLLQTLTASGTAALLLAVKAMFRDKLSPRWQFASWGILALVLLVPAGLGGRYALVNWPFYVETARSGLTGEFGALAKVIAPVPLPSFTPPRSAGDWLFCLYTAGAALLLLRCTVSYACLRLALRRGRSADDASIRAVAERYQLPVCPAVEIDGLSSALICGVFRPVLALPAGAAADEKILLHELLHLKYRDAAWGLVIAFFRCVHWCNPLLWLCANLAGNDLESLCDQRVLERLEGEDRRDYGRILLDMADEKYARAPGTSSMANGGRNIRRRIEAIARFKRYPKDMGLVSVCVVLVLAVPLLAGQRANAVHEHPLFDSADALMASARTTYCTTYAGAFDAYAKAVLKEYIPYRAMCAPLAQQNALAAAYRREAEQGTWGWEDAGLPGMADMSKGYYIYNLVEVEKNVWEGLLAVQLQEPPEGKSTGEDYYAWAAVQKLRAEKEGSRWVILPQGDFEAVQAYGWADIPHLTFTELPAWVYEAQTEDFIIRMRRQTTSYVLSEIQSGGMLFTSTSFDPTPKPDGEFYWNSGFELQAIYTGDPADKGKYTHIGVSSVPLREGQARPVMENPGLLNGGGNSTDGSGWGGQSLGSWWLEGDGTVFLSGGGAGNTGVENLPAAYAVNLYLNGKLAAELTLLPTPEGGMNFD